MALLLVRRMDATSFFRQNENCFFSDGKACAAYAWRHDKRTCRKIIGLADQTVRQEFVFNLRWDLEQTAKPVVFPTTIDWLKQPGDDPEFVYAFNRMHYWLTLGQAYVLTGNEDYPRAFVRQLESWVHEVKKEDPASAKAWRSIEAGIRMEYWMKAIRYFKSSPAITPEVLELFVSSMRLHMEFIMGIWDSYNLLSNWGVLANHGLFVASAMLPQDGFTEKCTKEAIRRLDAELRIQIYDDGVHWEQSAMYHNEVLHDYLDVLILAKAKHLPLPQGFPERIHQMATAAAIWQKPDGTEPQSGDSDRIDQRDLVQKASIVFCDPFLRSKCGKHLCYDALWDVGAKHAALYEAMAQRKDNFLMHVLQDSGQVYYQHGGTYLRFKAGTLGAGHGHADQLHLDVFARGQDILVDPGRYTYVPKSDRYEFKDSASHNTLTIDGKGSYACKDSWEYSKMSKAFGLNWKEKDKLCFFQAGHLGYYQDGVFVTRRVIVLSCDLIVILDAIYADRPHVMESHLHFGPQGKVTVDGTDFAYHGVKTDVFFKTVNAEAITQEDTRYSERYNQAVPNDSLTIIRKTDGFASLYTVMSIGKPVEVEKAPVKSNFKGTLFPDEKVEALRINDWIVVTSHQEWGSPTDSFNVCGHTGWGQCVVFRAEDNDIGTVLEY